MAKNVNVIGDASIFDRDAIPTLGIRIVTPFAGMFAQVDKLRRELKKWLKAHDIEPAGPAFLRYHTIDMEGDMDIEYGVCLAQPLTGDERVVAGELPAGRYVGLVYQGSGLRGNKALIEYIRANDLPQDSWDTAEGEAFHCRTERYLTDPAIEPRKTRWQIEVSIRLRDDATAN